MRRWAGILIASMMILAAVILPIQVAVRVARNQAIEDEFTLLRVYARDLLRRSEGTGDESMAGFKRIRQANLLPCSEREIELMRLVTVTSTYLQAIGRTKDGQLLCSSLGTRQPIPLGPVSYVSATGEILRHGIRLPAGGDLPLGVLEEDGFASILNPALTMNTMTDRPDVALGSFSPARQRLVLHRGRINPAWLHKANGPESDWIDQGELVTVLRSKRYDIASIAAVQITGLHRKLRGALLLFVPIGVICGLVLAGAVFYLARIRLSLPAQLRAAARRKEFLVEYQPVVDLNSREWVGAEALVRWRRYGEILRPDLFIPIAEESGVITLITECVLARVSADLPMLLRENPRFGIGINLSAADLRSSSTLDALQRLLTASGAPPSQLIVEVTERCVLQDADVRVMINDIRALGFDVAMDDFGTGYSSLSMLAKLNLNYLKIDKSFVETIGTDGATSHVVAHIIEIAHSLNLTMIAEGVETPEQAQFLAKRGVRFAQGLLFGGPMNLDAILSELAARGQGSTLQNAL